MRHDELADADCGIAQTLGVVGDWWSWLIIREVAGQVTRFDALQRSLGISRRALAERLAALVEHGLLRREAYADRPPRHDYLLTPRGEGLLPVLVAMQEFGDRFLLGDSSTTAAAAGQVSARVHALLGHQLPATELTAHDGSSVALRSGHWRVLYLFPGAFVPEVAGYPPGWGEIPGAPGCTLESKTYAARAPEFAALDCELFGVSTQRSDQQAAFAAWAGLPFRLLSDPDGRLAAALRLPMFRVAGQERYQRQSLLLGPGGVIRHVQAPITDPAGSVDAMLAELRVLTGQVSEETRRTDRSGFAGNSEN